MAFLELHLRVTNGLAEDRLTAQDARPGSEVPSLKQIYWSLTSEAIKGGKPGRGFS